MQTFSVTETKATIAERKAKVARATERLAWIEAEVEQERHDARTTLDEMWARAVEQVKNGDPDEAKRAMREWATDEDRTDDQEREWRRSITYAREDVHNAESRLALACDEHGVAEFFGGRPTTYAEARDLLNRVEVEGLSVKIHAQVGPEDMRVETMTGSEALALLDSLDFEDVRQFEVFAVLPLPCID